MNVVALLSTTRPRFTWSTVTVRERRQIVSDHRAIRHARGVGATGGVDLEDAEVVNVGEYGVDRRRYIRYPTPIASRYLTNRIPHANMGGWMTCSRQKP